MPAWKGRRPRNNVNKPAVPEPMPESGGVALPRGNFVMKERGAPEPRQQASQDRSAEIERAKEIIAKVESGQANIRNLARGSEPVGFVGNPLAPSRPDNMPPDWGVMSIEDERKIRAAQELKRQAMQQQAPQRAATNSDVGSTTPTAYTPASNPPPPPPSPVVLPPIDPNFQPATSRQDTIFTRSRIAGRSPQPDPTASQLRMDFTDGQYGIQDFLYNPANAPELQMSRAFRDPVYLRDQQLNQGTAQLDQIDPNTAQLRLDLGPANAPIDFRQLADNLSDRNEKAAAVADLYKRRAAERQQDAQRLASEGDQDAANIAQAQADRLSRLGDEYVAQAKTQMRRQQPTWVETPEGSFLVSPSTLKTTFKESQFDLPPAPGVAAAPEGQARQGFWNNLGGGLSSGFKFATRTEPAEPQHFSRSIFSLARPQTWREYNDYLTAQGLNPGGRAAAAAGFLAGDLARFGTISALLWRSNPMDFMDSVLIPKIAARAGVDPQDYGTFKRYAIPLGLATAPIVHIASGNLNPEKILNFEEGPRVDGFRAGYSEYENQTNTQNYPLALYQQILPGNSNFLLPWEEFKKERPDIDYEQYKDYQRYLWGEEGLQVLGGAIRATNKSIENPNAEEEPWNPLSYEARIGGYRITPVGAAAGLGALALGSGLIGRAIRNRRRRALEREGLTPEMTQAMSSGANPAYGYTVPNTPEMW